MELPQIAGDGYGHGNGDGYGYGGNGNGDGYGGNGDGKGDGDGWFIPVLTQYLCPPDHKIGLWWSDRAGLPSNGGAPTHGPAAIGATHSVDSAELCKTGLHATLLPGKWRGDVLWVVALREPVVGDDEKFVSTSRTYLGIAAS